jgi:hypothetical protein
MSVHSCCSCHLRTALRENANGLATVSNDDNTFECHIKLAEIKRAAFVKKVRA